MDKAQSEQPAQHVTADAAGPCTLVIFGATGDLTGRLLVPALYNLARWKLLPDDLAILAVGRTEQDTGTFVEQLAERLRDAVASPGSGGIDEAAWAKLTLAMTYLSGDVGDSRTYTRIADAVAASRNSAGAQGGVLFYLAVAPALFGPIIERLGASGLTRQNGAAWRRVIIEKPFGHDLVSAQELNRKILTVLEENQIYRIDHFLGKETVQNIMALRFGNGFFEPIWNRQHIDHVQITVSETVGVERRGRFYEATGALRDMVPNHLFQLFSLTAMEPPSSFRADAVRGRKQDVLEATHRIERQDVRSSAVRAQYGSGTIQGHARRAYHDEPDVAPDSNTETFAAIRLQIDNWRWAGVPFYLRTGKAMRRRKTEIGIQFKQAPLSIFRGTDVQECLPNWLVLHIQPDEGISLQLGAKVPGPTVRLSPVLMNFSYADYFKLQPSTGYETLIYDAMIGDAMLYQRADTIEAGWQIVQPILDAWDEAEAPLAAYAAGSSGPREADALLASDGRRWRTL